MLRPFDFAAVRAGAQVRTTKGDKLASQNGDELKFLFEGSFYVIAEDKLGEVYVFKPDDLRILLKTATNYVLVYRRVECAVSPEFLASVYSQYFTATAFETEGAARTWAFDRQVEIIRIIPVEVEI